jgi:flagellar hook assembly protein FlgD
LHVWLKAASEVRVAISDADNRAVRTMTARGAGGVNRVEWDIRRDDGRDAPPGVYRVDVTAAERTVAGDVVVSPGRR